MTVAVFRREISAIAAASGFLLMASMSGALAQPQSGEKDQSRITVERTIEVGVKPDTRESVAKDAIRVPAMGVTDADAANARAEAAPPPKKKKVRVVVRRTRGEIVHLPPSVYVPPHYVPRPYYRFGYSYGPGIRFYRW